MSLSKEKLPFAVAAGAAVVIAAGLALYSYMGSTAEESKEEEKPQGEKSKADHETAAEDKYIRYSVSNEFSNPLYDAEYNFSIDRKEEFWTK